MKLNLSPVNHDFPITTETSLLDSFGNDDYSWFARVGIILGGALVGALGFPFLVLIGLCVLGFTCWGIRAGSAAACCHSRIGDIEEGSCFSCLQSCGAGGRCIYFIIFAILGAGIGGYIALSMTSGEGQVEGWNEDDYSI